MECRITVIMENGSVICGTKIQQPYIGIVDGNNIDLPELIS